VIFSHRGGVERYISGRGLFVIYFPINCLEGPTKTTIISGDIHGPGQDSNWQLTYKRLIKLSLSQCVCSDTKLFLSYLRSWALLENLPIVQQLKNFPAFYGTWRFISVFTRALHWSLLWARSIQSIPSILILFTHLRLGLTSGFFFLLAFPPISYMHFFSPPFVLLALPVLSAFTFNYDLTVIYIQSSTQQTLLITLYFSALMGHLQVFPCIPVHYQLTELQSKLHTFTLTYIGHIRPHSFSLPPYLGILISVGLLYLCQS
jgi:hypothetical protein